MTASFHLPRNLDCAYFSGPAVSRSDDNLAIVRALGAQPWTQVLDLVGLARVAEQASLRVHAPGEVIVVEGGASEALWIVERGEVEVLRTDEAGEVHVLARLEKGAVFGEMSFLDGLPPSATVRSGAAGARTVRLPRARIAASPELTLVSEQLSKHLAREVVARLRSLDRRYTDRDREAGRETELRRELGHLFVVTVLLFGIGQIVQRVFTDTLSPAYHMAYSWGLLVVIVAVAGSLIVTGRAPISAFGLTFQGAARSAAEGVALAAFLGALLVGWRLRGLAPDEALFSWGSVARYSPTESALFFTLYLPHCFLQELVGRGVIQGSLDRTLGGARRATAVILTSVLFGVFHLYVSVPFAALTFVASLVFGALYARHRTLVGVTMLHFGLGLSSLALGFN